MAKRPRKAAGTGAAPEPAPEVIATPGAGPFASLIGQEGAVGVLQSALASSRIHHAWIFHGQRGVGKFTCAMAFAAALLDPDARAGKSGVVEFNPRGEVGRLLGTGAHPDLHVITKELARFSDDRSVRESKLITIPKDVVEKHLLSPAALAPTLRTASRAAKVFIVDEADLLDRSPYNAPVQNALLKTLEEPPAGTVIILVTESEDRLLATVRSRCQRVAFRPLDDRAMERWIESAAIEIPNAQRAWLLEYASGSPGRLREAVEHGLYAWHERLGPMLEAVARGRFVVELGAALAECADSWATGWVERHKNASKDAANKDGAARVLHMVAEHFRRRLPRATGEERSAVLGAIEDTARCDRDIDASVNLVLAMGNLGAQLSDRFAVSAPAR
jgi:hypothetical protein